MISVKIFGGLGNQMFQYAFAKSMNAKFGLSVGLDISGFDENSIHSGYMLDLFNTSLKPSYEIQDNGFLRTFSGRILSRLSLLPSKYIVESGLSFKDYKPFDGALFVGYFQSEKFFKNISSLIHEEFKFPTFTGATVSTLLEIQDSDESVSIHVRRADYLNSKNAKIYKSCEIDYYLKSINFLKAKSNKKLKIFVFSDDIEWAKTNLPDNLNIFFVEGNTGRDVIFDMALMSHCRYNIIANSTFSWWAAWLNKHPSKIVISPKQWFQSHAMNVNDIVPNSWGRL